MANPVQSYAEKGTSYHPASAGLAKGLWLGPDGNFHKGTARPGGATYGIVIGRPD